MVPMPATRSPVHHRAGRSRSSGRGQGGETLIESLLAIAILTSIVVAAYGGMQVSLRASASNDEGANAGTLLRSAAEILQDPSTDYIDLAGCRGQAGYTDLPGGTGLGEVTARIGFWKPSAAGSDSATLEFSDPGSAAACPAEDPGLQLIQLSVRTSEGATESLQITKRRS